jgi:hypothetical protein
MSEAHDSAKLQPRVIRFRDAPYYLGMDRNRFNAEVSPYLTEIPIGKQGVGFDRLELDTWLDEYVIRNERPAQKGVQQWDAKGIPGLFKRGGAWHVDVCIQGRRIGQSSGPTSLTDAEKDHLPTLRNYITDNGRASASVALDKQGCEAGIQKTGARRISSVNA